VGYDLAVDLGWLIDGCCLFGVVVARGLMTWCVEEFGECDDSR
jgi:hypothetical protein